MRTGILRLMPMFAFVLAACTSQENAGEGPAAGHRYGGDIRIGSRLAEEPRALRVRKDAVRSWQWELTPEGVRIYDAATRQLVRAIELPGWSSARVGCNPDLVLDGRGRAIVSSNVEPKLWVIDPDSLAATVREIRLHEREQWDVGFGALAYAEDGTLLGSTYRGGTLWRVDVEKAAAHIVLVNAVRTCDLSLESGHGKDR